MKSNLIIQLEQAIQESEQEKSEIERQIQALHLRFQYCTDKLESYCTALKFANMESETLSASKSNARHFHTSPNQLVAQVLKTNKDKWLTLTEIAVLALQLDGQNVGMDDITPAHRSAMSKILKTMLSRGIVEDKANRASHIRSQQRLWKLKPLQI